VSIDLLVIYSVPFVLPTHVVPGGERPIPRFTAFFLRTDRALRYRDSHRSSEKPETGGANMSSVRSETKCLRTFVATDDSGQKHTLGIWVVIRYSKINSDEWTATQGEPYIDTADGLGVRLIGARKFMVIKTRLVLRVDEPITMS
jgi:hypothetical protein